MKDSSHVQSGLKALQDATHAEQSSTAGGGGSGGGGKQGAQGSTRDRCGTARVL